VDFNRAGMPLAEIVSEPDMRSGQEAAEYGRELQKVGECWGYTHFNMAFQIVSCRDVSCGEDMRSGQEAAEYGRELQKVGRFMGIYTKHLNSQF
jgi:Asp-tRNA(Asn)/Glu-tRNA(Gln) amidotransferase B subunit